MIDLAHAETVAAAGVDVQFRIDFRALEGQVKCDAVLDFADWVVRGMDEEQRRRFLGSANRRRQAVLDLEVAGVEHDAEVRATAYLVNLIYRFISAPLEIRRG